MDVLSSRVLLRPSDFGRSLAFYREALGLSIYREFGAHGVVFFLGGGFLELSGEDGPVASDKLSLWLQVPDLAAAWAGVAAAGVDVVEAPVRKPWGLDEARLRDPDGVLLVLVEVPRDHPIRRDSRA